MEHYDLGADALRAYVDYNHHYKVRRFRDPDTGLDACIAVHNINLGPALGGCRMYPYASEKDAIRDVLRLSRGMTYKNALAGLPLGGGKSVIIGDPTKDKTEALFEAMGQAVHTLEGDYISAEDSGTSMADMAVMLRQTPHVMGQKAEEGQLGGDPSPVTAYGVFCGMKTALRRTFGSESMEGLTVAVQGLGAVGFDLCRLLDREGARLYVTDVRPEVLEKAKQAFRTVRVVAPDEIFGVDAQVFAPCALGAQLNETTIPQLRCGVVAGAANNQLATTEDGARLAERDILYTPDYALNAGGVIAVAYEYFEGLGRNPFGRPLTRDGMMEQVEIIGATLDRVFDRAETGGLTPGQAADALAEDIFLHADQPKAASRG